MKNQKDVIKKLKACIVKKSDSNTRKLVKDAWKNIHRVGVGDEFQDKCLDIYGEIKTYTNSKYVFESNVKIDLTRDEILVSRCQCHNHYLHKELLCEHNIAILERYIEALEKGEIKYPDIDKILKDIQFKNSLILLEEIENIKPRTSQLLKLDVNIIEENEDYFEVCFKVGDKKTYMIKNISEFLEAKASGEALVFGKNFTYDSKIHKFSKEDERVIQFLEEYNEISAMLSNNTINNSRRYFERSTMKLVKSKAIRIPEAALKRFLEIVADKEILVDLNSYKGSASVIHGDIPVSFSIQEVEEDIEIKPKGDIPKALTCNGEVYLYDKNIYLPSEENNKKYLAFLNAFRDEKKVVFNKENREKVFNAIIPAVKKIAKEVAIDKDIEDKITIGDLKLELYFDRNKEKVWCNVKAIYNEEKFDILKGYNGQKYIIRDMEKENEIIAALEEVKFYADDGKFTYTGDEANFYKFLRDDIGKFEAFGEVYYSDKFKEQKIYRAPSLAASLKEKGGFLEFKFDMDNVESKEFNNILKAFKDNRKFYKLKNNSFVDLEDDLMKDFLAILDNMAGDSKIKGDSIKVSKNKAIYLNEVIEEKEMNFIKGKDIINDIAEKFNTLDKINYEIPMELKANLREYQITGFKWFKTISHYGFGGILADEMGLGKTVQTIAFLLSEKGKKSLIVTPTSLIYNWQNEFKKFAPTMNICILHGDKEARLELMKDLDTYDVILTTYGTLRNDFNAYESLEFDYCIIDEGQNIKNPLAQSSEAVKEVKAKVKFALTGTPIENNLLELWSIFDFVMPGYLYNRSKYTEKFIGAKDESVMKELKRLIRPFILRRLKKNVMTELPDKIEKKFYVEMNKEQKKVYGVFVEDIKEKMETQDFANDKITVFSYLTKLRQLCLDPSLIVENYTGGAAKIDVALDLISENVENGNKVLLFSQFTSVLARIKDVLDSNNIGYYYLDGATAAKSRANLVDQFNEDKEKKVFLISLKAGGTGLNLTSANVVIHFDPWWNPAIEDQATDRAHRIGQKNVVEVIKLISQGTVEEKIVSMQESKKELINDVMEGDFKEGSFLGGLTDNEIKELFK